MYTNLIAQQNLRAAAQAAERHPDKARASADEIAAWRRAADSMAIPYDEMLQVHSQADNFTKHAEWDFENTPQEKYPLLLHFPYFDLYRRQVIKQADLVLAMHVRGDVFTPEEKARNFAYYEARTVRDSSLSAGTQAVLAAEVGHLGLAFDYLVEAIYTDLHDLHNNVDNGLHMASLAGAWMALVAGFGGMRDHGGELTFAPRVPETLTRFSFRMAFQGTRIAIDVCETEATYRIVDGTEFRTRHHGEPITITADTPVTMPIPKAPELERPPSPFGREPRRH
jgi:alpha,alpha-trehalose phosphorylase